MLDARKGRPRNLPGLTVFGSGLVGLWLAAMSVPGLAQSWPSETGPNGDSLGYTLRQFNRLDPPSVEAGQRAERAVPNMFQTDLPPSGMIDVGTPVITRYALPDRRPSRGARPSRAQDTRRRDIRRLDVRRSAPAMMSDARQGRDRTQELSRELADRDRQIRELRRQIEDDRRGAQESRGIGSALFGINPAAAATVTPR